MHKAVPRGEGGDSLTRRSGVEYPGATARHHTSLALASRADRKGMLSKLGLRGSGSFHLLSSLDRDSFRLPFLGAMMGAARNICEGHGCHVPTQNAATRHTNKHQW